MKRYVWLFCFGLLSISLVNVPVLAQEDGGSSVSVFPALIDVPAVRGKTSSATFMVTNTSEKALPLIIETDSLIPVDDIIDMSKRSQFDASRWLYVNPGLVALEPGQSKEITVNLEIPQSASPGSHYAEIAVKQYQIEGSSDSRPAQTIMTQVKIPVFIHLDGAVQQELLIESVDTFRPIYQRGALTTTSFRVANTGNTHLLPVFTINILKGDITVQTETFAPGILLPNTTKTISYSWTPAVPVGLYTLNITVQYGSSQDAALAPERAVVLLPWYYFVFGGCATVIGLYLFIKRQYITSAIRVLIGGKS